MANLELRLGSRWIGRQKASSFDSTIVAIKTDSELRGYGESFAIRYQRDFRTRDDCAPSAWSRYRDRDRYMRLRSD